MEPIHFEGNEKEKDRKGISRERLAVGTEYLMEIDRLKVSQEKPRIALREIDQNRWGETALKSPEGMSMKEGRWKRKER